MGVFRVQGVGNRVQGVGSKFIENANVREGCFVVFFVCCLDFFC